MADEELETAIARAMPGALKMALYAAKKQHFEVLKFAIEGVDAICNSAAMLREQDEGGEHVRALEETTKGFASLETQLARYKQALEDVETRVERSGADGAGAMLDLHALDALLTASLAEPKLNYAAHEFYKRFCEKAGIELEQDGDEDVFVQESESIRSTVCPVTQLEMENPLRNPGCNHTYSEQGIRSHLQRSKKCPVAGCPHKLAFASLERDVEMEVLIARRKQQHGSQQQQQQRTQAQTHSSTRRYSDDEDDEEEYVVD
ncbi:hypothetical protein PybrP1_001135 [[Pythium] brassicae (nom. inval.)]|nr:hypothetical protein PybrP1_001135 [[Pythium] brassicae (nom. inval.)]